MHRYRTTIRWQHTNGKFASGQYSRKHSWYFDGDPEIPASASPKIVPAHYSDPSAVDPEKAFVASLASCHMLWFLSLAAKNSYIIESYEDTAEGIMKERGMAITKVVLKPEVRFEPNSKPSQYMIRPRKNALLLVPLRQKLLLTGNLEYRKTLLNIYHTNI